MMAKLLTLQHIYICVGVCLFVCLCLKMFVCVFACRCVRACIRVCAHAYACVCVCVRVCACMCVCVCTCMCVRACVHVHVHGCQYCNSLASSASCGLQWQLGNSSGKWGAWKVLQLIVLILLTFKLAQPKW